MVGLLPVSTRMAPSSERWGAPVTVVAAVLLAAAGCQPTFRSTTSAPFPDALSAAEASAVHDIPCAADQVKLVGHVVSSMGRGYLYALDGCGQRVTYMVTNDDRALLIARTKLP